MKNKSGHKNITKSFILFSVVGGGLCISNMSLIASDLQIYSGGTAGGTKTFVMMLDNSGSMGTIDPPAGLSCATSATTETMAAPSGSGVSFSVTSCQANDATGTRLYDRMSNLKIAMFDLMATVSVDSDKSLTGQIDLSELVMGVGAFPQGPSAQILVSAKKLGDVGSDQRVAIERAVAGLSPTFRTPTAHAYAVASAHLLGTSTSSSVAIREKYLKSGTAWSQCDSWTQVANKSTCSNWVAISGQPTDLSSYFNFNKYPGGLNGGGYYRKVYNGNPKIIEKYWFSGTSWSECSAWYDVTSTGLKQCKEWNISLAAEPTDIWDYYKNSEYESFYSQYPDNYRQYGEQGDGVYVDINAPTLTSPLPTVENRQSCDGQGIYMLSDGEPNDGPESEVLPAMKNLLGNWGSSFSCPSDGLVNTTYANETSANSGWHCVGELARRMYDPQKNPQNLKFKTAFVGYGKAFESLSNQDQINACKLGSNESGDSCSPDATNELIRNDETGYGLGGYTYAQSSQDVLNSIVKFIDGLDGEAVGSLSTGAWAVPVDTLNPGNLLPHAYMRVLQPEPGTNKLSWAGNLKKYHLVDGVLKSGNSDTSASILNSNSQFAGPSDMWSTTAGDGGTVTLGGAYAKVPLPFKFESTDHSNHLRRVFTDLTTNSADALVQISNDNELNASSMLKVVDRSDTTATNGSYVLGQFSDQEKLKLAPNRMKRSLLNYLGYSVDINDLDLPSTLDTPTEAYNAMGGIIHSLPVQLTYEGELDADGILSAVRKQSTVFGTMEGGLRVVNAENGVEQMAFVPGEILLNESSQQALKPGQSNSIGMRSGVDAPWVADSAYLAETSTTSGETKTVMKASRMNLYGGMRMGGHSYYGLDVLDPKNAKFLFRIGQDLTNFSRMGQSWSKPVIANIKYAGKVRRVMIVGGGYDACYEDPRFTLKSSGDNSSCSTKTKAQGNAIYIVDALTGERLWWTSDADSNLNHTDLKHSIVSSISAVDGDSDGLADHLYFGDLGGQVFRVDLNNNTSATTTANAFATRVVKIANLATNAEGVEITNGDNPRFYEAPTITVHRDKGKKFILVSLASGDRSSPLDVAPNSRIGLPGLLTGRPVNNVYGLMDLDAVKANIMTTATLESENYTLKNLLKDPNTIGTADELINSYAPFVARGEAEIDPRKFGWYRSLSSTYEGVEMANGTFRKPGGLKAYEAPIAITGTLILSVFDPESSALGFNSNPCQPRIIGETYRQYYCLPFGACVNKSGISYSLNSSFEAKTGYQDPTDTSNTNGNKTAIGVGIQGNVLAPLSGSDTECSAIQLAGITEGTGEWQCAVKQQPLNWFSSSIRAY